VIRYFNSCVVFTMLCISLLVSTRLTAQQPWSNIISTNRAANWTTAGIAGGVPSASWNQCGATIAAYGSSSAAASAALINNAIAGSGSGYTGCATPYVVVLGAGDFYLNGGITLRSNVVLRGQGANSTRLHFSAVGSCNGLNAAICIAGSNTYEGGGYTQANWTGCNGSTVNSGSCEGATQIQLDSVSGIVVNLTPIVLDECNTGYTGTAGSATCSGSAADNNNLFVCEVAGTCSSQGANTGLHRLNRAQEDVVVATACTAASGTCASGKGPYTLTLSNGLAWPGWSSSQTPEAWWGSSTITNAGAEDFFIDESTVGQRAVTMQTANSVWARGIASTTANFYSVFNYITAHDVIRDSYFYWTFTASTESYGVGGGVVGDLLMENNILQGIADPINFDSQCSRCVAGYNFAVNQYYSSSSAYEFGMFSWHGAGESEVLLEGNIGSYPDSDDIWGTHTLSTIFRNYFNGFESNNGTMPIDNAEAIHLAAFSRYYNVIGNVLGNPLHHSTYRCSPSSPTQMWCPDVSQDVWTHVYDIGWSGNTHGKIDVSGSLNDMLTLPTTMLWGNYDVVTKAVHWCGNSSDTGWGSTCGGASSNVSSCAQSGNTVTCSSTLNPGIGSGYYPNTVTISGNSVSGYNATGVVTASSASSFSFYLPTSGLGVGSGGTAVVGSEIPTTDTYYPNSVPTSGDTNSGQSRLPSSFYNGVTGNFASCGTGLSFWKNPTTGTCPPYPAIGPDVSGGGLSVCSSGTYKYSVVANSSQCSGGTSQAANGGYAYANPAMLCYLNTMGGTPDGTGPVLTFNRASCYANDSASASAPLSPPSNINGNISPQPNQ